MAAYFNLNDNEISKELLVNKFNMILENQGRLALNDQCIRHTMNHEDLLRFFKFAKVLTTPVLKNSCEILLPFVLPQNIANSSGEFGLDDTSTGSKVSIFLNITISFDQMQPYHIYKLKNVSLTFKLKFPLKF